MNKEIVFMVRTCLACPSQWEALLKDQSSLYIRYRHGAFFACHGISINHANAGVGADILPYDFLENADESDCNQDGFISDTLIIKILEHNGYSFTDSAKSNLLYNEYESLERVAAEFGIEI